MADGATQVTVSGGRAERIRALGYDYAAQEKVRLETCNLCGSDYWTVITHRDRYGFPASATACNRCGLAVLNPRMTPAGYAEFYQHVYRPLVSAYHGRLIDAKTIQAEQGVYAEEVAGGLRPYLDRKSRGQLLDVGGSTGVVAAHLCREFGVRATVIDPAPDEVEEARELGIETICGLVEEWDPGSRRFDLVTMFQTVDHLLDVSATLAKLRALIADDGLFYMDIVDFRAAYLKNWSVEAAVKIDHPFSLTESTTEAYLARAGFAPIARLYSSDHHLVAYVSRPCRPSGDALPDPETVREFFRELRYVQNAPSGKGAA